jgi:AraC family transcriptional regulator
VHPSNIKQQAKKRSVDKDDLVRSAPGIHSEKSRTWELISAALINRAAGEVISPRSNYHRVTVALTAIRGVAHIEGGPERSLLFSPGELSFTPGGVSTRTILPAARVMQAAQRPATYDTIISEIVRGGSVHFEPRHPINDPLVLQIVSTLAYEMESGFLDHILVDALNTALAVRIVRHFVDPLKIAQPSSNGMSRERLRRVCDYIEAHLDDRLTLADLAGVACLSPYHFSRSFKQSVGVGPQRYVMERRIERAKALMRRTRQPLASIALEVGFTDQSHLTGVFRRETGMTPGRFRAALA